MTLVSPTNTTKTINLSSGETLVDSAFNFNDNGLWVYTTKPDARARREHFLYFFPESQLSQSTPVDQDASNNDAFTENNVDTAARTYTAFCAFREGQNDRYAFAHNESTLTAANQIAKIDIREISFGNSSSVLRTISVLKPTGYQSVHIWGIDVKQVGTGHKLVMYGEWIHATNAALRRTFLKIIDVPSSDTTVQLTTSEISGPGGSNNWRTIALDTVNDILYINYQGQDPGENPNIVSDNDTYYLVSYEVNFTTNTFTNRRNLDLTSGITEPQTDQRTLAFDSDDEQLWRFVQENATDTEIEIALFEIADNQDPVFGDAEIAQPDLTINANLPVGEVVRTLSASDPDDNLDRLTYSFADIADNDNDFFSINNQGVITIAQALTNGETYNLQVVITDIRGGTASLDISFIVRLFNSPVLPSLRQNWQVDEQTEMDDVIGKVIATHPDDVAITYTLSGTDATSFSIDASTGEVKTALNTYARDTNYDFNIVATDANNQTAEVAVRVTHYEMAPAPTVRNTVTVGGVANRDVRWMVLNLNQQYARHDHLTLNTTLFSMMTRTIVDTYSLTLSGPDADFFRVEDNRILPAVHLDVNRIYVFDVTLNLPGGIRDVERVIVSVFDNDADYETLETSDMSFSALTDLPVGTVIGQTEKYPIDAPALYHWAVQRSVVPPIGPPDIIGEVGTLEKRFDMDPLTGKIRVREVITESETYTHTLNALIRHTVKNRKGYYANTPSHTNPPPLWTIDFIALPTLSIYIRETVTLAPDYTPSAQTIQLPPTLTGFIANVGTQHGTMYSIFGPDVDFFTIHQTTAFLRVAEGVTLDADNAPFHIVVVAKNNQNAQSLLYLTLTGIATESPVEPVLPSDMPETTDPQPPQVQLPDGTDISAQSKRQLYGLSHIYEDFQYISSNYRIEFVGIREVSITDDPTRPFESIEIIPVFTIPVALVGETISDRQGDLYEILVINSVGNDYRQTFTVFKYSDNTPERLQDS